MKKPNHAGKKRSVLRSHRSRSHLKEAGEPVNTRQFVRDLPDDVREYFPLDDAEERQPNAANWSEPEDRSEDLINERDPFTQLPDEERQFHRENQERRRNTGIAQRS